MLHICIAYTQLLSLVTDEDIWWMTWST